MTTRLPRLVLSVVTGLVLATGLFAQAAAPVPAAKPAAPKLDIPLPSPASTLKQRVGFTDITIEYCRPGMKGREIFGSLVPYDQVWRTGANTATKITFSTDVKLNGTAVPAGTYELFTIPGKTEWTVIIHKNMSQWGAYAYDMKNDVARVKAAPFALPLPLENFTITFNHLHDESALLELAWEKTLVPVKLEVDVLTTLVPQIESVMASDTSKKPYVPAAMFYLEHNLDLKKALGWMDAAIAEQPGAYYYIYRKALVQEKMGDKEGSIATAKASIESVKADPKSPASARDEYIHLNEALIARLNGTAPLPAAQPAASAKPRVASSGGTSPHETISTYIGGDRRTGTLVTVSYGRPFSKDPKTGDIRKIWGTLVPWDKAYRLGSDEATLLVTPLPLVIGATTIPAGSYTLYLVPSETGATKLAFSTNVGKWGVPVDETHDLVRVDLQKDPLEKTVDQLTLAIASDKATGGGVLKIMWENTQFSVPFTIKK